MFHTPIQFIMMRMVQNGISRLKNCSIHHGNCSKRLGNQLAEDVVEGFQMLGRERGWAKLKLRSESKSIHKKEDTVISFCLRVSGI